MNKRFIFLLISAVIFTHSSFFSYADNDVKTDSLNLSAQSAVLIDSKTGDILYDKDGNKQIYPVSSTKILTAIIAIENTTLTETVLIDEETANSVDDSSISLLNGEVLTIEDLLHALLMSSADDSAVAIAKHISGSADNFSELMNQEAKRIGAKNSEFTNPTGAPDEKHFSTAYDLAVISNYAMKNESFREIAKKTDYTIEPSNKHNEKRIIKNSNKLLYSDEKIDVNGKPTAIKYNNALGVKMGSKNESEQCLISSLNISGNQYTSVVLNSVDPDIYIDTHKLFEFLYKDSNPVVLAKKNEFLDNISIDEGTTPFITAVFEKDFTLIPGSENLSDIEREFVPLKNIKLPIAKGQLVGKVNFKSDDKILGTANIVSNTNIVKEKSSKFYRLLTFLVDKWWFWLIVSLIVLRVLVGIRRVIYRAKRLRMKKARKKRQTN